MQCERRGVGAGISSALLCALLCFQAARAQDEGFRVGAALPDVAELKQMPVARGGSIAGKAAGKGQKVLLRTLLQGSLLADPMLGEALANNAAAQSRADASFALHYPTVNVYTNKVVNQKHHHVLNDKSTDFKPGVGLKLNLFSWGAINNQVKRDQEKERYFYFKYYETREELGFEIATQYLNALYYRDTLAALRESLARHEKILGNLRIIAENDVGRRSELVQGQAREIQVRQSIATYESYLETALSRLAKYTGRTFTPDQLQDPFVGSSEADIIRYTRADNTLHPTYLAQKAELYSVRSELKSSRARQLPTVNLEANLSKGGEREVFVNLSWNVFDRATAYTSDANAQALIAAQARLEMVYRDINERTRTAKMQIRQAAERIVISDEQIRSNKDVVHAYELQFKIARKTLIELLNSYNDLAGVELAGVNAHHDFRVAALAYLHAQDEIAAWAGVAETPRDRRYLQETEEIPVATPLPTVKDSSLRKK